VGFNMLHNNFLGVVLASHQPCPTEQQNDYYELDEFGTLPLFAAYYGTLVI